MSSQSLEANAALDGNSKELASIIKDAGLPPLTKIEIQGVGQGLGIISPRMFDPTKWYEDSLLPSAIPVDSGRINNRNTSK